MANKEAEKAPEPKDSGPEEPKESPYEGPLSDTPTDDTSQPKEEDSPEEAASRSTAEFVDSVEPIQKQRKKSHRLRKILIIIVVLALLGAGGYFLYEYLQDSEEQPEQADQTSQTETPTEPEAETIEQYVSTDFNLSFDYPSSWQVDDSEGRLKLESPEAKLPGEDGQEVDAKVVMTIVPTSADMDDFPDDQATAVSESEKFAYTQPAEGQREETFLSLMNIDGPSEGLNAVYITGDNSYVEGDPVTKADFDSVEPIVGLRFVAAGEEVTISADAWGNNDTLNSAFAVLRSLNIK